MTETVLLIILLIALAEVVKNIETAHLHSPLLTLAASPHTPYLPYYGLYGFFISELNSNIRQQNRRDGTSSECLG